MSPAMLGGSRPSVGRGWALVALVLMAASSGGCRSRGGGPGMRMARQPAAGRPEVCPDDAVDPYGDGTPSPMDLRCSYADTTAGVLTRIRGRVLVEGPPGSPGGSPGRTKVIVYEAPRAIDGPPGRAVAHATTDPQGAFTLGSMLPAGEYLLVVPDDDGGRPRVSQRITVSGATGRHLDDVRLYIPRPIDPRPIDAAPPGR